MKATRFCPLQTERHGKARSHPIQLWTVVNLYKQTVQRASGDCFLRRNDEHRIVCSVRHTQGEKNYRFKNYRLIHFPNIQQNIFIFLGIIYNFY